VLGEKVVRVTHGEPAGGQQRVQPRGREVRAVARQVEMEPAPAAHAGLHAGEVGHADEQRAARAQPPCDPLERGARVLDVLEHVPERDDVERAVLDDSVLEAGGLERDAVRVPAGAHAARRRLEPAGVVAGGPGGGHEAPAAGARVEQPRGRRHRVAQEREPLAVEQREHGRGGAPRRGEAVAYAPVSCASAGGGAAVTAVRQRAQRSSRIADRAGGSPAVAYRQPFSGPPHAGQSAGGRHPRSLAGAGRPRVPGGPGQADCPTRAASSTSYVTPWSARKPRKSSGSSACAGASAPAALKPSSPTRRAISTAMTAVSP
jgi:hypothetical protein